MLLVKDVVKGFNNTGVLNGVTFSVRSKSVVGVIGPTGGGKSVLFKILGGVYSAESGLVTHDDLEDVALLFQEGALFDSLSVLDNVAFPLVNGRVPTVILPKEQAQKVEWEAESMLKRVGLQRALTKYPGQLSGGMRRRVALARALITKPKLVLLDDPTSGLDPVASSVIMDLIVELHHDYFPITMMISHDLRRLLAVVDTVVLLFKGEVRFAGSVEELKHCADEELREFVGCRFDLN